MNEHSDECLEIESEPAHSRFPAEYHDNGRAADNSARLERVGSSVEHIRYREYWASVFPPCTILDKTGKEKR